MCSRFEQKVRAGEVAKRYGLIDLPPLVNMSEIRPTDQALVITTSGQARFAAWGFTVSWDNKPMINARSETLTEKVTFRDKLENRCIVPASSYFEWRKEGANKFKNQISVENRETFSLAGLMTENHFTIITCEPSPAIAHIHNRMPVILSGKGETAWINGDLKFDQVGKFLQPYDATPLTAEEDVPPLPAQGDLFA
jgi:putative SOS response-associated peptidase YedK